MTTISVRGMLLAVALGAVTATARAQPAHAADARQARLILGFGVDTTDRDRASIAHSWASYLAARTDSAHGAAFWSEREVARWPAFDLSARFVHQGFPPTLIELARRDDSTYRLLTLYAQVDGNGSVRPVGVQVVYAVREESEWVFANVLPRLTAHWDPAVAGPIHLWQAHGSDGLEDRARQLAAFAASLEGFFHIRFPVTTLYLTGSVDERRRLSGMEWSLDGGEPGGYAWDIDLLIVANEDPRLLIARHELVHIATGIAVPDPASDRQITEGLASWLAGARSLTYGELVSRLADEVRRDTTLTFDSASTAQGSRTAIAYAADAVLVEMLYEKGGEAAVRLMLRSASDSAFWPTLTKVLGVSRDQFSQAWRARVLRESGSPTLPPLPPATPDPPNAAAAGRVVATAMNAPRPRSPSSRASVPGETSPCTPQDALCSPGSSFPP